MIRGRRRAAARDAATGPTVALVAALAFSAGAGAADWRLTPRVSANEVYSDNVQLDSAGAERHDFITTLNAGASLRGTGARLKVNLDYNLQSLRYARSSSADSINHQLQGSANAELVEQIVFLDLRSTVSQANVSSTARLDDSNIAVTGNTTNVVTYSVTPIVRHHFGSYASAEARLGVHTVDTGGGRGSSTTTSSTFSMASGPEFTRVPWTINTVRRRIDNDSGTQTRFSSIEGTARYKFTHQYGVLTSLGYERNSFSSSSSRDGGPIWSIGGTWTPTPRTNVEAGYRSRYFDPSYFLNATHTARRMVFSASYEESLTTSSEQLLSRELIPLVDAFGEPVLDPISGDQVLLPVDDTTLTEEVSINRRLSGSASYRGRRNSGTVSVFSTRRSFQVSNNEDSTFGVSVNGSRSLSRRATLTLNGSWQRSNPAGAGGSSNLWQVGGGVRYQFSQDISTSLNLRRLTRDGDTASNSYDEHRATLRVDVSF